MSDKPETWRYPIAVVVLLVLLVAAVTAAGWQRSQDPRYRVVHVGGNNAVLVDGRSGQTWVLDENDAGRLSWKVIPST